MATLGDYKLALADLGYDNADTAYGAILARAINGARRDVFDERRWPLLDLTSTGTLNVGASSAGFPVGMIHVDSVRAEASGLEIEPEWLPLQTLLEKLHLDRANGTPCHWSRRGNSVVIYPRADRAYTLTFEGVAHPTDLATDGEVDGIFPEHFKWAVVWGAAKRLAFRQRDQQSRALASEEYAVALARLHAQYGVEQRQDSDRVQSSGFYDELI